MKCCHSGLPLGNGHSHLKSATAYALVTKSPRGTAERDGIRGRMLAQAAYANSDSVMSALVHVV